MICKICKQKRLPTNTGICILCSRPPQGLEIKTTYNKNPFGIEVKGGDSHL